MAEEYTPTTDEVRLAWAGWDAPGSRPAANAAFDRWLAAHDAQVRREGAVEALREAADAIDDESEATDGMYAGDCTERLRSRADRIERQELSDD